MNWHTLGIIADIWVVLCFAVGGAATAYLITRIIRWVK